MVSLAPQRFNCHVLGTNSAIAWKYKDPNNDNNWGPGLGTYHNGGGSWTYEPVSASRLLNFHSTFTVAKDHSLHQGDFDLVNAGDYVKWTKLGGNLSAPPAIAVRSGIFHIIHIGHDKALHHKTFDGVIYQPAEGFEKLEGEFRHSPTVVCTGPDQIHVFAIEEKDALLYCYSWKSGVGWERIKKLPGKWAGTPKAVSTQPGHWDVFGIDFEGNVNHLSFKPKFPTPHLEVMDSPTPFHALDAASHAPSKIGIFTLDIFNKVYFRAFHDGSWREWVDMNGVSMQTPKAVSHSPGALALCGVRTNGEMAACFMNPATGNWGGWLALGGVCVSRVG